MNVESISGHLPAKLPKSKHSQHASALLPGVTSTIGGYHILMTTPVSAPLSTMSIATQSNPVGSTSSINQWAILGTDQANLRDSLGVSMIISIFDKCLKDDPDEPPPAYLKQVKLKLPESFNRKDNNDTFNMWLENLLCFFDTLQLRGPHLDKEHISFTWSCLTSKAAIWYQQTVTSPILPVATSMLHFDSIVGLYHWFILTDQFTMAAKGFAGVRFEPHNGRVLHLYGQLVYYAECMFQPPNE